MRTAAVLCLLCGCDKLFGLSEIDGNSPAPADVGAADAPDAEVLAYSGSVAANTDLDVPFAIAPTAHASIVVFVATFRNALDAVTDDAGNTYVATPIAPETSPGGSQLWLLYAADINTVPEFRIHVATHATTSFADENETSAVAVAYPMWFTDVQVNSHAGTATGTSFLQDCASVPGNTGAIIVAGVSHDFQGVTSAGDGYVLRGVASEDYLTNATLAVEDTVSTGPDPAAPWFPTTITSGAPAWICASATFH